MNNSLLYGLIERKRISFMCNRSFRTILFQFLAFCCIYIVSGIGSLYLRIAAFAETKRNNRLMPLSVFLFDAPAFVIVERRFVSCFRRICSNLLHDKRQLFQIAITDSFQIVHLAISPILIPLFGQYTNVHQHVHRCRIASPLALVINRRMYFAH